MTIYSFFQTSFNYNFNNFNNNSPIPAYNIYVFYYFLVLSLFNYYFSYSSLKIALINSLLFYLLPWEHVLHLATINNSFILHRYEVFLRFSAEIWHTHLNYSFVYSFNFFPLFLQLLRFFFFILCSCIISFLI